MRALVITPLGVPNPARDLHGVFVRLRLFLQAMGRICGTVDMVHFVPPEHAAAPPGNPRDKALADFWGTNVKVHKIASNHAPRSLWQLASLPFSVLARGDFRAFLGPAQQAELAKLLTDPPDFIFAHRLPAMIALLKLKAPLPPVFFDLDDIEHQVKLRAANSVAQVWPKWRFMMEVPALRHAERASLALAARTFVCSLHDHAVLNSCGMDTQRTIPIHNAVHLPEQIAPLPSAKTILFLGNYGHMPNRQAVERLINRIWPLVRAKSADARLIVAGAQPDKIAFFPSKPAGVEFPGVVADLAALYAGIRVVCCPIENGGGTRIKLIEAAGYAKAIVATPIAVEGLTLEAGRDLLVEQSDEALASACLLLLENTKLAQTLALSARRVACALHSPVDIQNQIVRELQGGLAGDVAAPTRPTLHAAQRLSPLLQTATIGAPTIHSRKVR